MEQPDKPISRSTGRHPKSAGRPGWKWFRRLLTLGATFALLAVVTLAGLLLYLRGHALPVSAVTQTTQIYDIHGEPIDAFYEGQNRSVVRLKDISPYAIQAVLAIEDHRFFDHYGIDPIGLGRAIATNVRHMDKVEGASTITQQLARNLYLSHERTWSRKIKEAAYALQLELHYSKEQILEQYLNQIYYGHSTYGIEAASRLFFGKSAKELSLAESALLAGVPKGPAFYSPYMNEANAKQRQLTVLHAMTQHGLITQAEADAAAEEPLVYRKLEELPAEAPYFVDYVRQFATDKLGLSEKQINGGGLRIYTTLDLGMQHIAEQAVSAHLDGSELQGALVAVDPRNGHIKAMVGGKNYAENQYNRALADTRQPGSSFKPFVYLTALEQHKLTAVSRYKSEPTAFAYDDGRKLYTPSNFGNQYPHDWIDLREAIQKSDNIYAVHTIMDIGADHVIDTARKLGITSELKPLPSLALGTFPVSPLEMASAFAAIANQGVRFEPTGILRIEDASGSVLYEAEGAGEQAVSAEAAYVLTDLMQSVFEPGGTGHRVDHTLKRPVAAKTGTTNSDAWMVGFTPELSTAVWVGYDKGRTISTADSYLAAPIFADFTEQALSAVPPKLFSVPSGVVHVYIDPESGMLATPDCPSPRSEAFVAGTEPTEYCTVHAHSEPEEPLPDAEPEVKRSWWSDLKRWWTD